MISPSNEDRELFHLLITNKIANIVEELMIKDLKDLLFKYKHPFQNMSKEGRRVLNHIARSIKDYENRIKLKNNK